LESPSEFVIDRFNKNKARTRIAHRATPPFCDELLLAKQFYREHPERGLFLTDFMEVPLPS
jgi:hypothetical protein